MQNLYIQQMNSLRHFFKEYYENSHSKQITISKELTRVDRNIIGYADDYPSMTLKEIRERLHIPQSTLSSAVTKLKRKGILNRVISESDSRSFCLQLTQRGRQIKKEHEQFNLTIMKEMLDALDNDEERETLIHLLTKIQNGINHNSR